MICSSPSSSTQSVSTTSMAVSSGTTGVARIICTAGSSYTSSFGSKFQEYCNTDWPKNNRANQGTVTNLKIVIRYTFEGRMNACDLYNQPSSKNEDACQAITYNANLTAAVAASGGNCYLKSAQGVDVPADDVIASAAIVSS